MRRRTAWAEATITPAAGPAIGQAVNFDLLGQFKTSSGDGNLAGHTVMATHLLLNVTSAVAAGDGFKFGVGVFGTNQVQTVPFAFGASVVFLNPMDVPYEKWMFIQQRGAHPGYSFTGPNNNLPFDIRSKRKIAQIDQTLVLSVANTGAVANLVLAIYARVLLSLP
jgi:hypothetical protein